MEEDEVTYEIRCAYMENLLETIHTISDPEWQRKVWIEGSLPGVVDSWEETMCQFFNDANIDHFLTTLDPKFGFSQNQVGKLWELRNLMREYSDETPTNMDPQVVLADPHWHHISECAKVVLEAFKEYKVPKENQKI